MEHILIEPDNDSSDKKRQVNEFDEEWFVQHCCQVGVFYGSQIG